MTRLGFVVRIFGIKVDSINDIKDFLLANGYAYDEKQELTEQNYFQYSCPVTKLCTYQKVGSFSDSYYFAFELGAEGSSQDAKEKWNTLFPKQSNNPTTYMFYCE